MPLLPEPKIRCPKCLSTVCDIDPKWISAADKAYKSRGTEHWSTIRSLALAQFREIGPLKGWMTQGNCPEPECDGKWWDGVKLNVAVPRHLKEVIDRERESDEGRGPVCDGPGDSECL